MSEVINQSGQIIIKPGQDLLEAAAAEFRRELLEAVSSSDGELTIDLSGVRTLDACGLEVILAGCNSLGQRARNLRLSNVSPELNKIFNILRLDRYLTIE